MDVYRILMRVGRDWNLLCLLPVVAWGLAHGDRLDAQEAQQKCQTALAARGVDTIGYSRNRNYCFGLAGLIVDHLSEHLWAGPRDVQSTSSAGADATGTPAQSEAVPSLQPTALAAANVAAVGSNGGSNTITSLTLNPAMFFSGTSDLDATARRSRLADLTFFFPMHGLDQNGRVSYAGVRARFNLTASSQAGALMRQVRQATLAITSRELALANRFDTLLQKSGDPNACADALTKNNVGQQEMLQACGGAASRTLDEGAYAELRGAAAQAREEADAQYFGLDLRLDVGDPTLGAVSKASGTALVAGLGFGRRFASAAGGPSSGLRGRIGVRYVSLADTTLTDWQVDGGIGLEASKSLDAQRIDMSAGFDFRFSGQRNASQMLQTRFIEVRAALSVPIAGGTGITVSFSTPLLGNVSPTLSVSGNWQQLLAAAAHGAVTSP